MEMRASLEAEKQRLIMETKSKFQADKEAAVNEVKLKQWCTLCKKEAQFYCCWNTSYCNYPCQQAHWPQHMSHCTQSSRLPGKGTPGKSPVAAKNVPGQFNGGSGPSKPAGYVNTSPNHHLASQGLNTDNLAPSVFYTIPVGIRMNSAQL